MQVCASPLVRPVVKSLRCLNDFSGEMSFVGRDFAGLLIFLFRSLTTF